MRNIRIKPFAGEKIDAIIFDLGGVLLNLDFRRSIDEFIRLGFKNFEKQLSTLLSSSPAVNNLSFFHLYETGRISGREFRDQFRTHSGTELSDHEIDSAWTAMLRDLHAENSGLPASLKSSYRLFLLSNTNAIHIDYLHARDDSTLSYGELVGHFEKVYYSHEVNMRKPDREIFEHVLSDSGLVAGNSLFIDDSLHNIEAARGAGLLAYHHPAGTSLENLFEFH